MGIERRSFLQGGVSGLLAGLFASPAAVEAAVAIAPTTETAAATGMIEQILTQIGEPTKPFMCYLGRCGGMPTGRKESSVEIEELLQWYPNRREDIKRVILEGDLNTSRCMLAYQFQYADKGTLHAEWLKQVCERHGDENEQYLWHLLADDESWTRERMLKTRCSRRFSWALHYSRNNSRGSDIYPENFALFKEVVRVSPKELTEEERKQLDSACINSVRHRYIADPERRKNAIRYNGYPLVWRHELIKEVLPVVSRYALFETAGKLLHIDKHSYHRATKKNLTAAKQADLIADWIRFARPLFDACPSATEKLAGVAAVSELILHGTVFSANVPLVRDFVLECVDKHPRWDFVGYLAYHNHQIEYRKSGMEDCCYPADRIESMLRKGMWQNASSNIMYFTVAQKATILEVLTGLDASRLDEQELRRWMWIVSVASSNPEKRREIIKKMTSC